MNLVEFFRIGCSDVKLVEICLYMHLSAVIIVYERGEIIKVSMKVVFAIVV